MTTELTKAAQQALEVLESLQGGCTDHDDGTVEAITVWCPEVIEALRNALTQRPAAQTEREAFEAEMRCEETWGHRSLRKHVDGRYQNWVVDALWTAWQARASLPAPPQQATTERHLTVTTNRQGEAVMVSWQDDEHRILEVVWEREQATPEPLTPDQQSALKQALFKSARIVEQATPEPVVHKCRHCGVTTIEDEDGVTMQGLPAPERPVMFDPSADVPIPATPEPLIVKGAMAGMVDAQVRDLWPTKGATPEPVGEPNEMESAWCWWVGDGGRFHIVDTESEAHGEAQCHIDDDCDPGQTHEYSVARVQHPLDALGMDWLALHVAESIAENVCCWCDDNTGAEEPSIMLSPDDSKALGVMVATFLHQRVGVKWWTADQKTVTVHTYVSGSNDNPALAAAQAKGGQP